MLITTLTRQIMTKKNCCQILATMVFKVNVDNAIISNRKNTENTKSIEKNLGKHF